MAHRNLIALGLCLGLVAGATVEKREMSGNPMYGGGYGSPYDTAMAPYGAPPGAPSAPGMPMPGAPGAYPPPYGMQGFPDPGFSIQTGFEGYLVKKNICD